MAYDYSDFCEGRLVSQLTTGTTTGVTVQLTKVNDVYSKVVWPTGAHKVYLKRKTNEGLYIEKCLVASGTTQSNTTGVVTLGTLTRNLSPTDGTDTTGTSATITWPSGTLVYVAWDTTDAERTMKTNEVNTVTGSGAVRTNSTTTPVIRLGSVTTTQRDAMTPGEGDLIKNSTTGTNQQYVSGAWVDIGDAGTNDGSTTVAGKFEEATVAEQGTASATGGTGARLVPAVANLVKTSSGAADENKLAVLGADGKFASGFVPAAATQVSLFLTPKNGSPSIDYGCAAAANVASYVGTLTHDANSTGQASAATLTVSHTCTGSNRLLLVGVIVRTGTVTGVTYAGTAMTQIDTQSVATPNAYLFGLLSPASGANDIVVTNSGSVHCSLAASSYTGANQLRLFEQKVKGTDNTSPVTATISTALDNAKIIGIAAQENAGTYTAGTATTIRASRADIAVGELTTAKTPAGSASINFADSSGGNNAYIAASFVSAPAPIETGFAFDASLKESAEFFLVLPPVYTGGTVTAKFHWLATSSSGDVRWGIQAVAQGDNTALADYGTAIYVTDTLNSVNTRNITSATAAITIAGTPTAGKGVTFKVLRDADNAADTLAADAILLGVEILF